MKKIFALCSVLLLMACAEKSNSLNGEYKMLNAPEGAEITLGFDDTRFFGKAAINNYFGSFEKDGNHIKLSPAGSTMMAGPENLMKVEYQYLQNLEKVDAYTLDGSKLTLTGADNLKMVFEK